MDLKEYRKKLIGNEQERAVSPVIGVILMVAVTVILAATIATMVMGLGSDMGETAPSIGTDMSTNSGWDGSSEEDLFYLNHRTGDTLETQDLRVIVRGEDGDTLATFDDDQADPSWGDSTTEIWMELNGQGDGSISGETFEGGSTITIYSDTGINPDEGEMTVLIIDRSSDTTIAEHTGEPPHGNV